VQSNFAFIDGISGVFSKTRRFRHGKEAMSKVTMNSCELHTLKIAVDNRKRRPERLMRRGVAALLRFCPG
jgi:hypothetical protein